MTGSTLVRCSRGIAYASMWYASIIAGFLFLACPFLWVLLVSPPLFRRCAELLFSCWEMYPSCLMELLGPKILMTGEHIDPRDSAVLVMNHRTRVDWNFLWGAMYQACQPRIAAHKLKFVLKDPVKHVPGPGWMMQINNFLYIKRRWDEDQQRLARSLDYLLAQKLAVQLLIFPEGTDFTPSSSRRSDLYAAQHGLPEYRQLLHPKTTGFTYVVMHQQQAGRLDAVYDLTIAYPDHVPQCELDLLRGKMPDEVHFHVRRIAKQDVPKDEESLRRWLEDRWRIKERQLELFHKNKSFVGSYVWPKSPRLPLILTFLFWTSLSTLMMILLVTSPLFQLWTIANFVLFVLISAYTEGFNQLEISWYWKWKCFLSKCTGSSKRE
ncbi:lysocardiolipin acyltransferase 1-like [Trichogramma pretiosum]|uniref:lysocardiolipin acyltransferase 1-like n=1 Tax=Trichogramma pretiosum TaxID=7493 RepID=UPI0006C963A8|nr:lysocardiolipin acyltransferase 1-like [Trichogramma pretiosum]